MGLQLRLIEYFYIQWDESKDPSRIVTKGREEEREGRRVYMFESGMDAEKKGSGERRMVFAPLTKS